MYEHCNLGLAKLSLRRLFTLEDLQAAERELFDKRYIRICPDCKHPAGCVTVLR